MEIQFTGDLEYPEEAIKNITKINEAVIITVTHGK
jgi:hypothetical protein